MYLEFSSIELLFGYIKRKLKDIKYKSKEELAINVNKIAFGATPKVLQGFYRNTLNEI